MNWIAIIWQCIFSLVSPLQELSEENRTLNRLVKRQGVVLDRISSHQGELPSLLSAHNEEVRVMRQRMRQVRWSMNETMNENTVVENHQKHLISKCINFPPKLGRIVLIFGAKFKWCKMRLFRQFQTLCYKKASLLFRWQIRLF